MQDVDFRIFGKTYTYCYQPQEIKKWRPWLKKCSGCGGKWFLDNDDSNDDLLNGNSGSVYVPGYLC